MTNKMKMYSGILLFSFVFLLSNSFAQKAPNGIVLGKDKTEFLDKTEITVSEWLFYHGYMMNKFGENSIEAQQTLPDTALLRQVYGFSFFPVLGSSTKETVQNIREQHDKFPMTCVSYQQVLDYCQWRADRVNERWQLKKKSYHIIYTLPSKEDYDKAMQKAIISQNQPLSSVTIKNKFTGLTDNVAEYTYDKEIIIAGGNTSTLEITDNPSQLVGFRCKAIVQKTYKYPINPKF